jgi:hypothetical protein
VNLIFFGQIKISIALSALSQQICAAVSPGACITAQLAGRLQIWHWHGGSGGAALVPVVLSFDLANFATKIKSNNQNKNGRSGEMKPTAPR